MQLQQDLKDACESHGGVDFRNDYSGRGMYGRRCVGITGDHEQCHAVLAEVIKDMAARLARVAKESMDPDYSATLDDLITTQETFGDNIDTLMSFAQDSMGYNVIIYWPSLKSLSEEEEHDGQPDEAQEWHDFDPDA